MFYKRHIEAIAAEAWLSPEVAAVVEPLLHARPELRELLAQNEYLSEPGWYRLWPNRPRPPASICVALADRPLDPARRRWVLDHDTRTGTLKALIGANCLGPDEQRLLLANKGAPGLVAKELLAQSWVDPALARQTAETAGGWTWLAWLAGSSPEEVPDSELAAFLDGYGDWEPAKVAYKERSAALKKLLARRPALIEVAARAGQHEAVVTAAAGSRHLHRAEWQYAVAGITPGGTTPAGSLYDRRFTLLALVNSPVCHDEVLDEVEHQLREDKTMADVVRAVTHRRSMGRPTVTCDYDRVDDPEVLRWLVRRALPYSDPDTGRARPGQPYDLPVLAANPHLDADMAESVARGLTNHVASTTLDTEVVNTALDLLVARFADLAHWRSWVLGEYTCEFGRPARDDSDRLVARRSRAEKVASMTCSISLPAHTEWLHYAESHLGTDTHAWENLLGLVDSFEGTFAELVEVASAL